MKRRVRFAAALTATSDYPTLREAARVAEGSGLDVLCVHLAERLVLLACRYLWQTPG